MISTASLRSLPPQQVLAWALQEKAKRKQKDKDARAALRSNEPRPHSTTSLVLDPNHPLYRFHHEAARYKVAWGGRASAKSWGVAESLIRKTCATPLTVLCTREYQVSIKDSAHRLLKDTINRLGLHLWFQVTKDSIKSSCGAEFIFKGLYNNDQGIRSTEGVDICWVEEAQSVREASWRSLLPTIRKPGSEIWITFNLMDESDATYQRFVAKPRKNSIVLKLNYDSNPFLPETMREEMEEDKARDYHMYEHIWLGMPLRVTDAIVLNRKYTVREFADDLWLQSPRLHFGMDFGFSQDPTAVVRFFILENMRDGKSRLYIEYEAYEAGVELDDMGKWMRDRIPEVTRWPVKAAVPQEAAPMPISSASISWLKKSGRPGAAPACSARVSITTLEPLTRTSGWGRVRGDRDQLCSAAALHSGDKPSGPPTSSATSRPSSFQASSACRLAVSNRAPPSLIGCTWSTTRAATSRPLAPQAPHSGCSRRKAARTERHCRDW